MLFLLVLATRALGQSALSVASITAVGKSFDRSVGVAMGVYSVLLSVLFAVGVRRPSATRCASNGWRAAWAQVAYGLLIFAAPAHAAAARAAERPAPEPAMTRPAATVCRWRQALRTPAFWVFGGATSLFGLVSSGLGLFNEAVLAERGFDQQTYVSFLAGTTIVALAGQLACGWLTLRWPMQRLLGHRAVPLRRRARRAAAADDARRSCGSSRR